MLKIAVLGGSFDPVHNAHLQMAECALSEFKLDKIIFVPAYKPPHKSGLVASGKNRYDMLSFAIKDFSGCIIDDYELSSKKQIYSYRMLDYLKDKHKNCNIKMLIGADSFNQLGLWKNVDYICKNYGFYVMARPDVEIDKNSIYYDYCMFSKKVMNRISSTEIRSMIKNGRDVSSLVPKEVEEYIKRNKLYCK